MTTRISHDLLDPTMIFLVAEQKVTSMTCRGDGNERKIAQGVRQVFSKGWRYDFAQDHKQLGKLGTT